MCCDSWGPEESDTNERLNWTDQGSSQNVCVIHYNKNISLYFIDIVYKRNYQIFYLVNELEGHMWIYFKVIILVIYVENIKLQTFKSIFVTWYHLYTYYSFGVEFCIWCGGSVNISFVMCGYSLNISVVMYEYSLDLASTGGSLMCSLGCSLFHQTILLLQGQFAESRSAAKSRDFQAWNTNVLWVIRNQGWQQSTKCLERKVVKLLSKCIGEVFYILVTEITKLLWDQLCNANLRSNPNGLVWGISLISGLI